MSSERLAGAPTRSATSGTSAPPKRNVRRGTFCPSWLAVAAVGGQLAGLDRRPAARSLADGSRSRLRCASMLWCADVAAAGLPPGDGRLATADGPSPGGSVRVCASHAGAAAGGEYFLGDAVGCRSKPFRLAFSQRRQFVHSHHSEMAHSAVPRFEGSELAVGAQAANSSTRPPLAGAGRRPWRSSWRATGVVHTVNVVGFLVTPLPWSSPPPPAPAFASGPSTAPRAAPRAAPWAAPRAPSHAPS